MQQALRRQDSNRWSSKSEILSQSSAMNDLRCLTVCCPIFPFYNVPRIWSGRRARAADAAARQPPAEMSSGWQLVFLQKPACAYR